MGWHNTGSFWKEGFSPTISGYFLANGQQNTTRDHFTHTRPTPMAEFRSTGSGNCSFICFNGSSSRKNNRVFLTSPRLFLKSCLRLPRCGMLKSVHHHPKEPLFSLDWSPYTCPPTATLTPPVVSTQQPHIFFKWTFSSWTFPAFKSSVTSNCHYKMFKTLTFPTSLANQHPTYLQFCVLTPSPHSVCMLAILTAAGPCLW